MARPTQVAARWLKVPARDRFPSRLEGEAQRYGVGNRIGYSNFETPVDGSEQLAPWLHRVKAPGRVSTRVDLDRIGDW